MHGRKKVPAEVLGAAELQLRAEKIAKFRSIYDTCFAYRDSNTSTRAVLDEQRPLLEVNPECYSIWSHRRRVYEALWVAADEEERPIIRKGDLVAELKFSTQIITKEYKCYAAWVHRRWIINSLDAQTRTAVLQAEHTQLEALLRKDERNFHAWGYRRWVTRELAAVGLYSDSKDMEFSATKIEQNFSNYSAWHCRALVLQRKLRQDAFTDEVWNELAADLRTEVEMVVRAYYCDPADQSAWMYTPFLVDGVAAVKVTGDAATDLAAELRGKVLEAARELAADCQAGDRLLKWPLWIACRLTPSAAQWVPMPLACGTEIATKAAAYAALARVDPMRAALFQQWATADGAASAPQ